MIQPFLLSLRVLFGLLLVSALQAGDLKIHVINVGWGSSVLVEGPSGKRVLLEAGHTNRAQNVVAYLQNTANVPAGGIDYVVLGHNHTDHGGGLPAVWSAGFIASSPKCYYNGSTNNASLVQTWFAGAGKMPEVALPSATTPLIDLGDGTQIWCIASKGQNLASGSTPNQSSDENDNSMGLVVKYGGFTYLWTSDMGGFELDGCSGRSSAQADVETPMIQAAIAAGVLKAGGVDVLEVGHHGSESSTNPDYVKAAHPSVAIISTGRGQSSGWDLPRTAIVDNILLGSCGFSPSALVLQTEDGDRNDQGKRSTSGFAVGNIIVDTDGSQFWVSANGDASTVNIGDGSTVAQERADAGLTGTSDPRGRVFAVHGGVPAGSFSLALNPTSMTLARGASASTQVAVQSLNGFTGSVALKLATAVPGVTATFTPSTVTAPGSATLTLTASSSASAATTVTQVSGTSGSQGANAPLTVQVTAPTPTFTLSVAPSSVSVAAGSSTTTQVTVQALNGFSSPVTLSLGTAIPGVTATFSPATITGSGTATLTLTAASSAASSTTSTAVKGVSGSLSQSSALSVQVAAVTNAVFNEVEPNDTRTSANVVPATATSIVGYFPSASDVDDWYQLTLPAGHTLVANMVGPTASQQDYDLYLTSSTGTVLATSENSGTTESVSYKNTGTTAKTLYVHVVRYNSYSRVTPYTITLTR
jgi:beta-lactamase superfamily II metal-dependent hydrolase